MQREALRHTGINILAATCMSGRAEPQLYQRELTLLFVVPSVIVIRILPRACPLWFFFALVPFSLVLLLFVSPSLEILRKTQRLLFETTMDVLWDQTWAADHISNCKTVSASGQLVTFRNLILNLRKHKMDDVVFMTTTHIKIRTPVSGYILVGRRE